MKKNKNPKIILEFEPSQNFKEEFLEFVKEILSWNKSKKDNEIPTKK